MKYSKLKNVEKIKNPIDIAISFDSTTSMRIFLKGIKENLADLCYFLKEIFTNIKFSFVSHGDYQVYPQTQVFDFESEINQLESFLSGLVDTYGGDIPEAYELALLKLTELSWRTESSKVLFVIGDSVPHPPSFTTEKIYWRNELQKLLDLNITIHGIFCKKDSSDCKKEFFKELSEKGSGIFFEVENISEILSILYAGVCNELSILETVPNFETTNVFCKFQSGTKIQPREIKRCAKPTKKISQVWWSDERDFGQAVWKWPPSCDGVNAERAQPLSVPSSSNVCLIYYQKDIRKEIKGIVTHKEEVNLIPQENTVLKSKEKNFKRTHNRNKKKIISKEIKCNPLPNYLIPIYKKHTNLIYVKPKGIRYSARIRKLKRILSKTHSSNSFSFLNSMGSIFC